MPSKRSNTRDSLVFEPLHRQLVQAVAFAELHGKLGLKGAIHRFTTDADLGIRVTIFPIERLGDAADLIDVRGGRRHAPQRLQLALKLVAIVRQLTYDARCRERVQRAGIDTDLEIDFPFCIRCRARHQLDLGIPVAARLHLLLQIR